MGKKQIGDYRIQKHLGAGTTGKVKLAVSVVDGKEYAIKIIKKSLYQTKPSVAIKIQREISLMQLTDHAHLLKLIEVLESPHNLYIVLEYAASGELFDYLLEQVQLDQQVALHFFRQIIFGLEYLHSLGVCHRDLKPENILLDDKMQIKIADFGFARFAKNNIAETSCGSPHYAAPEVIKGIAYDGRAADVWSCGVILYALLCGYLPFDDPSVRVLLNKVKKGSYQMPALAPEVCDLISRLLVVDPVNRITIAEIKELPIFKYGLPPDYILPSPLPFPSCYEPVDADSVPINVVNILKQVGFSNEELVEDLTCEGRTMAKVFFAMLTNRYDYTTLPWEASSDSYSGTNDEQNVFIFSPNGSVYNQTGGDVFHRHQYDTGTSFGGQSMEMSFVDRVGILANDVEFKDNGSEVMIEGIQLPISSVLTSLQQYLLQNSFQIFHPDDMTLIVRQPTDDLIFTILCIPALEDYTSLQVERKNGEEFVFSEVVQNIHQFIFS